MTTGRLYDIQGFSVQDGPGIRTTAFLKGCPLRCPWCHSPESQAFNKQLSWMSMRCLGLDACRNRCMNACPKNAIEEGPLKTDVQTGAQLRTVHVKRDLCDDCGKCADKCYAEALTLCGKDYTSEELVARLLQDKNFFDNSGGGVTISGGEPLCQIDFVVEVLQEPGHQVLRGPVLPAEGEGPGIALVGAGAAVVAEVPLHVDHAQHFSGEGVRPGAALLQGVFRAGLEAAFPAGVQPQAAHVHPAELLIEGLGFRAVAPGTAQGTALQEGRGADAGAVLHGEALNVEDLAGQRAFFLANVCHTPLFRSPARCG